MRRRHAGFTLLELLTVLTVLGVVSTIGIGTFFRITDYWRATTLQMDLQKTASHAFDEMQRDFDQIISTRRTGAPLWGERRLEAEKRYQRVQLEDDRFVLPIEMLNPVSGLHERFSVLYEIDRSGAAPALIRVTGPLGAQLPEGARQIVAEGVLALRAQYYDGTDWQPAWKGPALPEAVRISLVVMDSIRPWEQIVREHVFNIYVK
jgi:prepilin-type N-terminal cleavage/methylation domain-containing protein